LRKLSILSGAAVAVAMASGAQATTTFDYNLFVLGNMTAKGSDTQGKVAVGGNANLTSYAVGENTSGNGASLVVGKTLTAVGGSTKGNVISGSSSSLTWYGASGTTTQNATTLPVDFASEATRFNWLTGTLAGYANTGSVSTVDYSNPWYSHGVQMTLTGNKSGVNVFTIDAASLAKTNTFTLNLAAGSTALINVTGTSASLSDMGITINGGGADDVLWNFSQATSITLGGVGLQGSILAPKATYTGGNGGSLNGQVVVGNFLGDWGTSTQVNYPLYSGTLLGLAPAVSTPTGAVPEVGTWAMMIVGFGLIGSIARRGRRRAAAAV
jgi:choice-of-anchor A domain-containing protein